MFAPRDRLLRVAKAKKSLLESWHEGVSLQTATGRSLDELRQRVTSDRVDLAARLARRARLLMDQRMNRDAISRAYYSMYHSWRAMSFFETPGDDNDDHVELPKFQPHGFPNVELWQNRLKVARVARNRADYDAYPKAESAWYNDAASLCGDADELLRLCRRHLRGKGCGYL